jgi:hypothetical protein
MARCGEIRRSVSRRSVADNTISSGSGSAGDGSRRCLSSARLILAALSYLYSTLLLQYNKAVKEFSQATVGYAKEGVLRVLLKRERRRSLQEEWPAVRERLSALELELVGLLEGRSAY